MGFHLQKTLVLVGLMGAGKTAIGTILAQELGVPFVDSDDEIVKAANMSIAEIFERDGEAFFREKETLVIERLLTGRPMVLSTGGGAFMQARNQQMIAERGVAVWLNADLEILWERVKGKTTRPLLMGKDAKQVLAGLYETRNPEYAKALVHVESQRNQSKGVMVERVIKALLENDASGVTKDK
ncbi:shikimate kinase [Amylibacter marinus]|uniref:Shikimate kinase n=2 Tax=Amylibacter marinus TaxID=1475483 RepID=A0ABQ5VSM5_9RHOB|nr:shikimate kinase [Amylibacter marinus]